MISVVLTIQLQLRHIIILQGWWRFFKVDGAHEELRFYIRSCCRGFFSVSLNLGGGKICPRGPKVQPIPPVRCYDENATELKLVQEWVVKCPKNLFTFADMSHWSWWYEVGIFQKDRNFIIEILYRKFEIFVLTHKSKNFDLKNDYTQNLLIHFLPRRWWRNIKWFCLIWAIYAKFVKKMTDSSQLNYFTNSKRNATRNIVFALESPFTLTPCHLKQRKICLSDMMAGETKRL